MDLSRLTIQILADILGLTLHELLALLKAAPKLYWIKRELKKSGKTRIIEVPHKRLKDIQRTILYTIFRHLEVDHIFHGAKGSTTIIAATPHIYKPYVISLDLKDFFPGISRAMIRRMLLSRGANIDVAQALCRLTTFKNHLPHGSPSSPRIAQLVLHPAALRIRGVLNCVSYPTDATIWFDDIIISGPRGLKRLLSTISGILEDEGFAINRDKIKVMPSHKPQIVLGIQVNRGIEVPKTYFDHYIKECDRLGPNHPKCKGMRSYIHNLMPQ